MIEKENARHAYNDQEVLEAGNTVLSLRDEKTNGKEHLSQNVSSIFIDADEEQAIWEDWLRHGTPHGETAPVIIAQEVSV